MKFLRILAACSLLGFGLLTAVFAESKLISSDPNRGDQFGWSVDISGHTIIVGAPINSENNLIEHGSA
ncbi:MAG: FG-GAP repeat protein, partial [Candidatus Poribacteria bacterium]|nr:FG-GAP repeat protein [Candidatus Poribacteria bacterium]